MKNIAKNLQILLCAFCCLSCATRKNTWATRSYHALVTHYNIFFNGNESFKEGILEIEKNPNDDFSKILPIYAVNVSGNAQKSASQMDKAIEKCRKAIKLHSIQQKPKPNPKKAKDPKYQAFMLLEEYNPQLKNAWLLQAKAEYHKGDFMGAVATCSYILRHFSTENEVVLQAKLWQARAYASLGWLYEAEEVLSKIAPAEITYKQATFFSGAQADVLLAQERFEEAVSPLLKTIEGEKNRRQRTRMQFVLAQVYEKLGKKTLAQENYEKVAKSSPNHELAFNAQISLSQLASGSDKKKVLKTLDKLAKATKNRDFLDQIYFAKGNIYLSQGDEKNAVSSYKKAIESSTRGGIDKARALVKLADLNFEKKNFAHAHPLYTEAAQILSTDNADYKRVSLRAQTLGDLVFAANTVALQDSLQRLAKLPEKEKLAVIEKVIEDLKKREKEEKERQEAEAYRAQREAQSGSTLPTAAASNDWYFYNANLISKGKNEFRSKWGLRALEDNWRRVNKVASALEFADNLAEEETPDSTATALDDKNPLFYLKQLPDTPEKLALSNRQIADALFDMGYIYYSSLEEKDLASETFAQLWRRFPDHERVAESYFHSYNIEKSRSNETQAAVYKQKILTDFAQTRFAAMLLQPNFSASNHRLDSIYQATYQAYSKSDFSQVYKNYQKAKTENPTASLMPKFALLNALSVGKSGDEEKFKPLLEEIVALYPQSEVTPMAKDILALFSQGNQAQAGSTHGAIISARAENLALNADTVSGENAGFSAEKVAPFTILLALDTARSEANRLVFDIAAFNFSRFLIKEYDLNLTRNGGVYQLEIFVFDGLNEATWYFSMLKKEPQIAEKIVNSKPIFISEDNLKLLKNATFSQEEYEAFFSEKLK